MTERHPHHGSDPTSPRPDRPPVDKTTISRFLLDPDPSDDEYRTKVWHGCIQYGHLVARNWFGVGGVSHPLVQSILADIVDSKLTTSFDIYLAGGILQDWITWDMDMVLVGPFDPSGVRDALEVAVRAGFQHHLFVDIHFVPDPHDPLKIPEHSDFEVYQWSDIWIRSGESSDACRYVADRGLYRKTMRIPTAKMIQGRREGVVYHPPQLVRSRL